MDNTLIREIAIAGHWRTSDVAADIFITDFDLKNLRIWTVTPGDWDKWREWVVRAAPMPDETFSEINSALREGRIHPVGDDLGTNLNGRGMKVRAFVNRERRGGREWLDSFHLPLPRDI